MNRVDINHLEDKNYANYQECRINTFNRKNKINAGNREDRMNPCYQKNKMRTEDLKNRMMRWDLKNRISVEHQKNKMSVVEGDNDTTLSAIPRHQTYPHHPKPKSKTEIGFCNGISFCILSATRYSAICLLLFNIILIIGK